MNPFHKLDFDIRADRGGEAEVDAIAMAEAQKRAAALLAQHGISVPGSLEATNEPSTTPRREYSVRFGPVAGHAAADLVVKAQVPWDAGTVRLIQSPMRADLALEVVTDEDRAEEFAGSVLFVSLKQGTDPIAILPNASPVFTRLFTDDLSAGLEVRLVCVAPDELSDDQVAGLKRSLKNLRDPGSLAQYKTVIARAEQGE